jgi:hypothetical protein
MKINSFCLSPSLSCHTGQFSGKNEQTEKEVFNAQNNIIQILAGIKMMSPVQNSLRYLLYFPLAVSSYSHYCH